MIRLAEAGQRPAVVALEWSKVAFQLLQWPFLLALHRLLGRRGRSDLVTVGVGLGLAGMILTLFSHTFSPTLSHALGEAYVEAQSPAEGAAISAVLHGLLLWRRGLNQTASILYQSCVGLLGLALIRARTWQTWGWVGLVGALLALPAKLPLGIAVPTNFIWTGLAYFVWPIALGIRLLGEAKSGAGIAQEGEITGREAETPWSVAAADTAARPTASSGSVARAGLRFLDSPQNSARAGSARRTTWRPVWRLNQSGTESRRPRWACWAWVGASRLQSRGVKERTHRAAIPTVAGSARMVQASPPRTRS